MGKKQLLNRRKTDPGKFIFTGQKKTETIDLQLFEYNTDTLVEQANASQSVVVAAIEKDGLNCWANLYGLHDETTIVGLCKQLGIHNLVIQDILDVNQRPKFQAFENFNFFTIKSIVPNADLLETEHISFVIGKNYLISFQEQKGDFFEHLRYRIRENVGLLRTRGVDFLLFTLLEAILDNYFKTLQDLEVQSEMLNQQIGTLKLLPEVLDSIESFKRKVYLVRKAIVPIKDFTANVERGECTFVEPRHQKYFLEIKDLCLTLLDTCETLDKLLEGASNRYFSLQNHKLNEVMKILTVVSTVFIPLTFIAGIYGMNFTNMPELDFQYGYAMVLVVMAFLAIGIFVLLRKKKWL